MIYGLLLYLFSLVLTSTAYLEPTNNEEFSDGNSEKPWQGKWFPSAPGQTDNNPVISENNRHDPSVSMSISNPDCDDTKTNITIDWDGSPTAYTCYRRKRLYLPNPNISPVLEEVHIPKTYYPQHVCMNMSLEYMSPVPTFGPHRPLWARYGEYKYVPKQRWLHNLEHGAVVMLYHPCANSAEVNKLKTIVKNCLYRHIITPYRELEPELPMALVTWGWNLRMSMVDPEIVTTFIREHALKGREKIFADGQYNEALTEPAKMVTDKDDSQLCPQTT